MFLWKERAWWAAPFVIALLIIAVLVVLAQSPPVAPFLYTTF